MSKSTVDWEAVEIQYRAGVRSLKDIGAEFGVSDAGIIKKAKKDGWTRDLGAKIRAKAEALVSASVVSKEVSEAKKVSEREVVEANATMQADIIKAHRSDIGRYRKLVSMLITELEAQTGDPELFVKIGEILQDGDVIKLSEAYNKVLALPQRIKGIKELSDTLKTLIALEREAFGIDSRFDPEPPSTENVSSLDIARRVAFILRRGVEKKG